MIRTMLIGTALVAALIPFGVAASSASKPKSGAGSSYQNDFSCIPSECANAPAGNVKSAAPSGKKSKYLQMELKKTLVVPVRPQMAKPKGELKAK